jgi:hypothetical protein
MIRDVTQEEGEPRACRVPTALASADFGLFFGRETLHRAYALALSRGLQGIGGNFLAHTTDVENKESLKEPAVREEKVNNYKEIFAWTHKYGGPYSMMKPMSKRNTMFLFSKTVLLKFQKRKTPHNIILMDLN